MSQYQYGKNPVLSLLRHAPERVYKLFISNSAKPDKRIQEIESLARDHGIIVQRVPPQKLNQLLESRDEVHQGVVANIAPKALLDIDDLIKTLGPAAKSPPYPLVIMLDGINDPQNLGAILRVADGVNASAVILPKHGGVGLTPAVAKTAAGADATMDMVVATNLTKALEALKQAGFWSVGTANTDKAQPYHQLTFNMPTVLVMGSEEKGISRLVLEHCDFLAKIPMLGQVSSLNVAAATAVLAYHIRFSQPAR